MNVNEGIRAALALDVVLPRKHRAKAVARALDCSVRMAKYLLAGEHWSKGRLAQVQLWLGDAFESALSAPDSDFSYSLEVADLERRVAKLKEHYRAELARLGNTQVQKEAGGADSLGGRGSANSEPREPEHRELGQAGRSHQ